MTSSVLPKPEYKDNWAIFKNVTFPPFQHPRGCSDTIESKCYRGDTLDECMKRCEKTGTECGAGYYLKAPDKPSFCLPLRTSFIPELNPIYDLRNKGQFENTDNLTTYSFINTDLFPYPPDDANVVFYTDRVILYNVERDISLAIIDPASLFVDFKKPAEGGGKIIEIIRKYEDEKTVWVNFGDEIAFSVPETNLVLKANPELKLVSWTSQRTRTMTEADVFILRPLNPKRKKQRIYYGECFNIIQNHMNFVALNDHNNLEIYWDPKDKMVSKGRGITFKFIPVVEAYYCDKGVCKPIPLANTETDGVKSRFEGKKVFRSELCFGLCAQEQPMEESQELQSTQQAIPSSVRFTIMGVSIAVGLVILLFFIVYVIRLRRK
jgi:hypothetical protein